MLHSTDFRSHIESVLNQRESKLVRGKRLYPHTDFDCSLPQDWVNRVSQVTRIDSTLIIPHFVWGYPNKSVFGEPFPLSLKGCDILALLEKLDK